MSFNDLERGQAEPLLRGGAPDQDTAFTALKDSVSIQIFKIQSNVQGIQRLVDKLGGNADGDNLRTSLHNLTEATRDMVKHSTLDVKKLAAYPAGGELATRKPIQTKLSKEFANAITAFQRVQKLSAEKQRLYVENQKRKVNKLVEESEEAHDEPRGSVELEQVQTQQQVQHVSAQELEFQETLIAEREAEIREIESGIHELNDIFRDLGTMVVEQGGLIDNIESNVISVARDSSSAAEELTTAHEYQRKAGKRMVCLLIILAIVAAVILLAVSNPMWLLL
ncbi:syntaxin 7 [Cryptococcus deuterogattii 99/473]|uniref:Syntaxin 7 n=1 Tax=Cryptococcus deuterogattii Ram5 TaxID=1296110 RepID=A0A0D0UV42_9TREE|nr:syntaxin 7 [Cryptococcus deuterogattii LA55]KIR38004.1 syntaxin 7 [Cryptococcus deuterogattii Ram5]KIR74051.1 syntaxin 7 [Cryptococcus deuterogattii CA1014]KIR94462.1 syntaxin 7 [Cryptococcus deuterogattii CBS 10090]KIY54503.1 syntaxin 7 [Cryptococcus deuterogattii 99/473]